MIKAIIAIDEKNGMSKKGIIPWNIPSDTKSYKELIQNAPILMGHKTKETHGKPLNDKPNFVLTREYRAKECSFGFITVTPLNLESVLKLNDLWVIGGAQTFEKVIDKIDIIYMTRVNGNFGCDTFFPEFANKFQLREGGIERRENGFTFHVEIWQKKS